MIGDAEIQRGPYPFRFFNIWLEEKEMMKNAITGWKECVVHGSKGFVLFSKAKASKARLKNWIKGKKLTTVQPSEVEQKLALIDTKAEKEGWSASLSLDMSKLLEDLWRSLRLEE